MTKKVSTIDENSSTIECLEKMRKIGSRHLPTKRGDAVVGVVSIINCLNWLYDEFTYYEQQGMYDLKSVHSY
jgi:signal-transduction protein with cAMP-binding, CBS, and nucleotidyltransferase domain